MAAIAKNAEEMVASHKRYGARVLLTPAGFACEVQLYAAQAPHVVTSVPLTQVQLHPQPDPQAHVRCRGGVQVRSGAACTCTSDLYLHTST
jgi:hypothetical protein